jgi:alpha-galactosidase
MVGEEYSGVVSPDGPPGWWDFMLRILMNGQFGISSQVSSWPPALRGRAAANVALYKQIRALIGRADVYHLTPPPAHDDPCGWMAIEYVPTDREQAVVMAYRLTGAARQRFPLRGLDPAAPYRINGQTHTGQELMSEGLEVNLDAEWRAGVIELQAE